MAQTTHMTEPSIGLGVMEKNEQRVLGADQPEFSMIAARMRRVKKANPEMISKAVPKEAKLSFPSPAATMDISPKKPENIQIPIS